MRVFTISNYEGKYLCSIDAETYTLDKNGVVKFLFTREVENDPHPAFENIVAAVFSIDKVWFTVEG